MFKGKGSKVVEQIKVDRKRMRKSKVKYWNKMRKKLEEKFLPISYFPIKCGDLKNNFYELAFDDEAKLDKYVNKEIKFDEYLNEEPLLEDWYESGFEGNLNQHKDRELLEELTFNYFYESEFEENIGKVDAKEWDKEILFDDCYPNEFEDKEVDFIELLWSPRKSDVAPKSHEEEYGYESEGLEGNAINSLEVPLCIGDEEKVDVEVYIEEIV